MSKPRVVFAGTGSVAAPALRALAEVADIALVISQPPRPTGKSKNLISGPAMQIASEIGLRVITPERIELADEEIKKIAPDVMVVVDYGQIIKAETLAIPRLGALNLHPSLLPRHRGPAPVPNTILSADTMTGVTIIQMDSKMDHGPIIAQEEHQLNGTERASNLLAILANKQANLISRILGDYCADKLVSRSQDHDFATFHSFLSRQDGEVRSAQTAEETDRRFRAFYPWPGLWLKKDIRGKEKVIKFLDIALWPDCTLDLSPASFIWHDDTLGLVTAKGVLKVNQLQVEGGNPMSGKEFYAGYKDLVTS